MTLRSRNRRRDFWRSAQWPILWILAVVSVVLGHVGFGLYYAARGETHSWWDLLYYALQLFPLQSGALEGTLPWQLHVARFLAPLVGIYTATQALAQIFRQQLSVMRVRWYRDHVVIFGLGRKGQLLAKAFRALGDHVVAVELDENNDHLESCRAAGVRVFLGDATDAVLLRRLRIRRARLAIAISGTDAVNAEIAVRVRALATESGGSRWNRLPQLVRRRWMREARERLTCVVHVFDPEIWALLRELELTGGGAECFQLKVFNIFESGAPAMLAERPRRQDASQAPHLLVVGLGQLGESVVLRAASSRPADAQQRLRVTVVDEEADSKCESLGLRAPQLKHACDLIPCAMKLPSPVLENAAFAFDEARRCTLSAAFVCLDDETAGLGAGLALHRGLRGHDVPIVVRLEEDSGLATLLTGTVGQAGRLDQLFGFGLLERTCGADQILPVSQEALARAMHDAYVRERLQAGESAATNAALVPWEKLSKEKRGSNLRKAADVGRQLAAIDCEVRAVRGWKAEAFELDPDDVELVARLEHERWLAEKRSLGFTYAPGERDDAKRTNPFVREWGELDEKDREEMNRRPVRKLPALLAASGFEIRRLPARAGAERRGR